MGGITACITADEDLQRIVADTVYGQFFSEQRPQVSICLHGREGIKQQTDEQGLKPEFSFAHFQRHVWQAAGKQVLSIRSGTALAPFHLYTIFDNDFRTGEVYSAPSTGANTLLYHVGHFWFSMLLANFLGRQRGMLLHACGVSVAERGLVFAGPSGSGKSTMARLWHNLPGARVLNDDMLAIRKLDGRYRLYGLPWSGNKEWVSATDVPLDSIFFIQPAPRNRHTVKGETHAAKDLLLQPFLGLCDRIALEGVLDLVSALAQDVPCYELGFTPDRSVVDYIRDEIK